MDNFTIDTSYPNLLKEAYQLGYENRQKYITETEVPAQIKMGDKDIVQSYVNGLFPYPCDGYYYCYSTNREFMEDLKGLMETLDVKMEIYEFESSGRDKMYGIKQVGEKHNIDYLVEPGKNNPEREEVVRKYLKKNDNLVTKCKGLYIND